jgi:hypothetical protein
LNTTVNSSIPIETKKLINDGVKVLGVKTGAKLHFLHEILESFQLLAQCTATGAVGEMKK